MMDLMKKSQRIPSIKHNTDRISDLHRNAETLVALDFLGLGSMAINGPDHSSVSIMDRSSASLNPSQLPANLVPDSSPNLRNMAFNLGTFMGSQANHGWNDTIMDAHAHAHAHAHANTHTHVMNTTRQGVNMLHEYGHMTMPSSSSSSSSSSPSSPSPSLGPSSSFQPNKQKHGHHCPAPPPQPDRNSFPFLTSNNFPTQQWPAPPIQMQFTTMEPIQLSACLPRANVINLDTSRDLSRQPKSVMMKNNELHLVQPSSIHSNVGGGPGAPEQLTIFYGGSVCVYNDVSLAKAQEIMMMASKNVLPMRNTTKDCISSMDYHPLIPQQMVNDDSMGDVPRALPQARKVSLARFLERRKQRIRMAMAPYNMLSNIPSSHGR